MRVQRIFYPNHSKMYVTLISNLCFITLAAILRYSVKVLVLTNYYLICSEIRLAFDLHVSSYLS